MKSLILIITFLVSFGLTSLVVAEPVAAPIFEMEPPAEGESTQADLNERLSDLICKSVGANGIVAQTKKNEGIPVEVSVAQFDELVAKNSDNTEPANLAHAMSRGMIESIYDNEIAASTKEEMASLGMAIYTQCRTIADKIRWEAVVE
jgi:hypothetical protein